MENGVKINKETINSSNAKKHHKHKPQNTGINRDMCALKRTIVKNISKIPRRMTKYFDQMLMTVSNAKQSLGITLTFGDFESRIENLNYSLVLVRDLVDDATILHEFGYISEDTKIEIVRLVSSIEEQSAKLMDYYKKSQGVCINTNNTNTNEVPRAE